MTSRAAGLHSARKTARRERERTLPAVQAST